MRIDCPSSPSTLQSAFGFPVPFSYGCQLAEACRLRPAQPHAALEPVGLYALDAAGVSAEDGTPYGYADTPVELFVFAWTGVDGGHIAFIVDNLPTDNLELPIAEWYPNNPKGRLLGSDLAQFLQVWIGITRTQESDLAAALADRFSFGIPDDPEAILFDVSVRRDLAATPTLDGLGVELPRGTVDEEYVRSVSWLALDREDPQGWRAPLREASKRLARGEPGTALVLARNARHLWWRADWRSGRDVIRETSTVLVEAYASLHRQHLAARVVSATDWALEQVG
jgi:hypothetical protein